MKVDDDDDDDDCEVSVECLASETGIHMEQIHDPLMDCFLR
jgi:hypothetical protein